MSIENFDVLDFLLQEKGRKLMGKIRIEVAMEMIPIGVHDALARRSGSPKGSMLSH